MSVASEALPRPSLPGIESILSPSELSLLLEDASTSNDLSEKLQRSVSCAREIATNLERFSAKLEEGESFLLNVPEFCPGFIASQDDKVEIEAARAFCRITNEDILLTIPSAFGLPP
jgi:hypothetical protein